MNAKIEDAVDGKNSQSGIEFDVIEYVRCMRCRSAIPRENISHEQMDGSCRDGTRRISLMFCEHCGIIYKVHRVLQMGQWNTVDVSFLEDEESLREARRRLDKIRGDRQLNELEDDIRAHGLISK